MTHHTVHCMTTVLTFLLTLLILHLLQNLSANKCQLASGEGYKRVIIFNVFVDQCASTKLKHAKFIPSKQITHAHAHTKVVWSVTAVLYSILHAAKRHGD